MFFYFLKLFFFKLLKMSSGLSKVNVFFSSFFQVFDKVGTCQSLYQVFSAVCPPLGRLFVLVPKKESEGKFKNFPQNEKFYKREIFQWRYLFQ
ncbi:hypothetical protein AB205_0185560 [Aquarana catesbeiana]|uniref:Uncharacterized protein n=1 Tax=Aquarana catesbeiana TaxID=8400 RepID=A0A2G9SJZ9_AQUCT|nr:hypothetical protein AB205_0185560 [Aquarana catesbeiana]